MTSDCARFLADFLLPRLASEYRVTCRVLGALPEAQHVHRPHAKAMSAMELAEHIAICEIWFLDGVLLGRFGQFPTHLTVQDYPAAFADRLAKLQLLDGESLAVPLILHGVRTELAVTFSAYLRALGAHVPAIYVESADEPDLEIRRRSN